MADDDKVQADWRYEMLRVTKRLKRMVEDPDAFDASTKAELLGQADDLIEHAEGELGREAKSLF